MNTNELAKELIDVLRTRGLTISAAESLTGGEVCSTLVTVPGASDVLQGGVVAYSNQVKSQVLGVAAALLAERGAVNEETAVQMATGASELFQTDFVMATTGVAGPGPQEGIPAGVAFVAVQSPNSTTVRKITVSGDRAKVREAATFAVLGLCLEMVRAE